MSEEEQKYFKGLIGFTFDSDDIKYIEKIVDKKDKEIEKLNNIINEFNKLIENEINESKLEEDYDRVDAMEYCLATLRELKGNNNGVWVNNLLEVIKENNIEFGSDKE